MLTAALFRDLLARRILVLDGAMGTMLQRHRFEEADFRGARFADWPSPIQGNNDVLCLTQPDAVRDVHRAYLAAGADVLATNTFNAQAVSMEDYGMGALVREINVAAAAPRPRGRRRLRSTPDRPRFVAGAIGPMNRTLSLSPDVNDPGMRGVTFDGVRDAYAEQVAALVEGGVDLLLVETVFDTLNCKAAIAAIRRFKRETGSEIPVMISGTIVDLSGRTLVGQTVEAFWNSVMHAPGPRRGRLQLLARRRAAAARTSRSWRGWRRPGLVLPQRRPAQRARRLRRAARRDGGRHPPARRRPAGRGLGRLQPRRRLLRHDARAHRRHRGGRRRRRAARDSRPSRPRRALAGLEALYASPTTRCSSTSASGPT